MDSEKIVLAWEKRVGPQTAHLVEGEHIKAPALYNMFRAGLKGINTEKATILDYGCGGGFLGEFLFKNDYPIGKYIGMDITYRAVDATVNRLIDYKKSGKVQTIKIDPLEIADLSILKVNVLTSFNVVQHFPDKDYFDYFFNKLNTSEIPIIVLNYRKGDKTEFQNTPYKTTHDINLACYTNAEDIKKALPNYKLVKQPKKDRKGFETLQFKIKQIERDI